MAYTIDEESTMRDSRIASITAREVFTDRGHPGVESTVVLQDGSAGTAVVTAGVSVGEFEVQFVYDGGTKWGGKGVRKAVDNVNTILGPALIGKDATDQTGLDQLLIELDGTPTKKNLGGNATGSISAAALQAGAHSVGLPLYRYIGGIEACTLPVPGVLAQVGHDRYGGGRNPGGKPTYSFICHGFGSFAEASYAAWEVQKEFFALVLKYFNVGTYREACVIPKGKIKHDREMWDVMAEAVKNTKYVDRIGFQVDVAATTYYDPADDLYKGLFSDEPKTKDDLSKLYHEMVRNYPFVIIEDPLQELDYEGHAMLTRELGIQITGDDLFTTNVSRLTKGFEVGAANTMLLKVYQIGTITEAFQAVELAYQHNYNVMPCDSRGEGVLIADYVVGLGTGHLREGALGPIGNRFLKIEQELGSRAQFLGLQALKGKHRNC